MKTYSKPTTIFPQSHIITIVMIIGALTIGIASIVFAMYKLTGSDTSFVFSKDNEYSVPALVAPPQEPVQSINNTTPIETQNNGIKTAPSSSLQTQSSVLWDVPFVSQAPSAHWDEPYQNFCEEATVLMAAFWAQDKRFISQAYQEQELNAIKDWEMAEFGDYVDTDAKQTARILTDFFHIKNVAVKNNPTILDIKNILSKGGIVIVPTAGRMLKNPNFRGDGPLYHMLVIRGYNDKTSEFITNDPGTRKGEKYLYSYTILDKSIANWYSNNRTVRLDDRQIIAVYHN